MLVMLSLPLDFKGWWWSS